jgi:tetratricopeptide (TPR) repeat protein
MIEAIAALMGRGAWEEAKAASQKLVFDRPTAPEAHAYLGLCYYHESKWEDALKCFERATLLNPQYWEAGAKMALCLDHLLRFDEAYEVATYWQRIHPSDRSLNALVDGLSHHLTEKVTDGWQKSMDKPVHIIEFTH